MTKKIQRALLLGIFPGILENGRFSLLEKSWRNKNFRWAVKPLLKAHKFVTRKKGAPIWVHPVDK
jgi:hypothetical protein